ncbi:class I SAM-dependent methyltransferase [Geomonas sp.]|uniref:class I SAM-dependent methyltransferase n=1 Tax=Geomonas sp. TaxID=2651584 RepID=UPI002B49BD52|nr:class I SAM-dependent methyltransferase [Geomonas sp.]HJV34103.1 class I SAM-dependent methyltransferase [Geomonas sp.]
MEWQDGYVTEIEYVHGVYRELGPSVLNLVLLIQSIEPVPIKEGFTYCDLGCGQGGSVNLFAACHPEGEFHAVDFNPAHITGARELSERAGLQNVSFWEASFAELDSLPLPDFDFVVMHGIYSWVGPDNRQHIRDFLLKKVKPGGVVYLSYNSLPGWSAHAPLRELLSSFADTQPGSLDQRVDRAIAFADKLKKAGAAIFETNPATSEFFDYLCTLPRNYLAHEFFNHDWTLFYHADIVRDLAAARLTYAGSAHFADNQDMLRFSERQQQLIDGVSDRVMRETVKDFTAAPLLRRDVFTKGRPKLAPSLQLEHFCNRRFALVAPQSTLVRKAHFPIGEVLFDRALYDPILQALELKPQSLQELMLRREVAELGMPRVIEAVMVLLCAEYLMPAVEPGLPELMSVRRFNSVLLDRQVNDLDKQSLASPVLQNACKLEWLERLLILCEINRNPDPLPWLWKNMKNHGHKLTRDGEVLHSDAENLAELKLQIESFRALKLPLLRQLGIL